MTSSDAARRTMVDCQLRTFDVSDKAVLAAMGRVSRERFVPAEHADFAYLDRNVPFGGDPADPRVVLAPMTIGRLLQALEVQPGDRVLDVAGGFGYASALLAAMGARPVLLESRADLAEAATGRCAQPIAVRTGALEAGSAGDAPFDCILINGTVERRPDELLDQLAPGGRLACLSRDGGPGRALLFVRSRACIGYRTLFDATAPTLAAFRPEPAFTF